MVSYSSETWPKSELPRAQEFQSYIPEKDRIFSVRRHKNPRIIFPIALGRARVRRRSTLEYDYLGNSHQKENLPPLLYLLHVQFLEILTHYVSEGAQEVNYFLSESTTIR
jgi:hypothetical protein